MSDDGEVVDQLGDRVGPTIPEPERQLCGRLLDGLPCSAPAAIHGDMGETAGFACLGHAVDFVLRCVDTHVVDSACGLPESFWFHARPSYCAIPWDVSLLSWQANEVTC